MTHDDSPNESIPVLSTLTGLVGGAVGFYFGGDTHHYH